MSEKKKFVTTIVVETDFDPSELGPSQIVLSACTGSGRIISQTTVTDADEEMKASSL